MLRLCQVLLTWKLLCWDIFYNIYFLLMPWVLYFFSVRNVFWLELQAKVIHLHLFQCVATTIAKKYFVQLLQQELIKSTCCIFFIFVRADRHIDKICCSLYDFRWKFFKIDFRLDDSKPNWFVKYVIREKHAKNNSNAFFAF